MYHLKPLILTDEDAHVWCAKVDLSSQRIKQLNHLLTPDEQNRANKFHFEKHRDAFITSRGYLRIILSRYLSIEPDKIVFNYNLKGKPYLATHCQQNQLQFNLSHSQDLILYAITRNRLIGIDLEYLRPFPEAEKIAIRFFTPQEAQFISICEDSIKSLAFFQGWTGKEALLKATGEGLAGGLETIEVEIDPDKEAKLLSIGGDTIAAKEWFLTKIIPAPEYIATMAIQGKIDYKLFNITDLEENYAEIS